MKLYRTSIGTIGLAIALLVKGAGGNTDQILGALLLFYGIGELFAFIVALIAAKINGIEGNLG